MDAELMILEEGLAHIESSLFGHEQRWRRCHVTRGPLFGENAKRLGSVCHGRMGGLN
jgi:hypothetical protein